MKNVLYYCHAPSIHSPICHTHTHTNNKCINSGSIIVKSRSFIHVKRSVMNFKMHIYERDVLCIFLYCAGKISILFHIPVHLIWHYVNGMENGTYPIQTQKWRIILWLNWFELMHSHLSPNIMVNVNGCKVKNCLFKTYHIRSIVFVHFL